MFEIESHRQTVETHMYDLSWTSSLFLFPHGQSYLDYSFSTVMKKHCIVRKFAKITTDAKDMHQWQTLHKTSQIYFVLRPGCRRVINHLVTLFFMVTRELRPVNLISRFFSWLHYCILPFLPGECQQIIRNEWMNEWVNYRVRLLKLEINSCPEGLLWKTYLEYKKK
jgi:hypothetical protein